MAVEGRPDKPLGRRGGRFLSRRGKQLPAETGYGAPPPPPPAPIIESREAEAAYGAPREAEAAYGAPREAEAAYGAPREAEAAYGAPVEDYGAPTEDYEAYDTYDDRAAEASYGAPDAGYGAPREAEEGYGAPLEEYEDEIVEVRNDLPSYAEEPLDTYNDLNSAASDLDAKSADGGLDMLMKSVPGIPGEDYPIYSEAPETAFSCEGQVNGGYYADPEAECQVFHICSDDAAGGLAKYSFLCPNGTIFNQNYFICDWWFNVDCSEAEALAEAKNSELVSAREAAAELAAEGSAPSGYGAPAEYGVPATEAPVIEAKEAAGGYGAPAEDYVYDAASDRDYADYEEPLSQYGAQAQYEKKQ